MRIAIHQPCYFPYLGFLKKLQMVDLFIYLDNAQFEKNGFQNRNRIRIDGKSYWLTIPVLTKGRGNQAIKDVEVCWDRQWNFDHYNSILYNYSNEIKGKEGDFRAFYLHDKSDLLIDWCVKSVDFLCRAYGIKTKRIFESDLSVEGSSSERLANICKEVRATTYLSGPSGRNYLDESVFGDIKIEYMDWKPKSHLSALHFCLKDNTEILNETGIPSSL